MLQVRSFLQAVFDRGFMKRWDKYDIGLEHFRAIFPKEICKKLKGVKDPEEQKEMFNEEEVLSKLGITFKPRHQRYIKKHLERTQVELKEKKQFQNYLLIFAKYMEKL